MGEIIKNRLKYKEKYTEILLEELKIFDEASNDRLRDLKLDISESRKNFKCKKCGECCKLAVCANSPQELLNKAENGDKFAREFVDTFSEYEDIESIKNLYPDYFETVEQSGEKLYFYHCNLITEENLCPRYEDRPNICREFPNNPLEIFPISCEYKRWQNLVIDKMIRVKVIADILNLEKENKNG